MANILHLQVCGDSKARAAAKTTGPKQRVGVTKPVTKPGKALPGKKPN